jgi:hypothetical protein
VACKGFQFINLFIAKVEMNYMPLVGAGLFEDSSKLLREGINETEKHNIIVATRPDALMLCCNQQYYSLVGDNLAEHLL